MQKYPNNNFLPLDRFLQTIGYSIQHTIQVDMRKVMETSKFFEIQPREQPRNFHKKYPQINYMLTVQSVFTTMQFTDRFSSTSEIL